MSQKKSPEDFERRGPRFEAQFPGRCSIDWNHVVKRGDIVARISRADNPMIPVAGVACKNCTKLIPKGEE